MSKKNTRGVVLIIGGMLLSLSPTGAQKHGPTALRVKFTPGEISRYRMNLSVQTQVPGASGAQPGGYNVSADLIEQQKVTRALPGGGGELAVTTVSGTGTINGQPFNSPPTPRPALITFDARGNFLSATNLPTSAGVPMLTNLFGSGALSMQGLYLSPRPVKPGDTWTQKVKIAGITGGGLATVKATLVKWETIGRFDTARIHAVVSTPLDAQLDAAMQPTTRPGAGVLRLTGQFTMIYDSNFAIAEGKVVRAAGNGTASVLIQQKSRPTPGKPASTRAALNSLPRLTMKLRLGNNLIQ